MDWRQNREHWKQHPVGLGRIPESSASFSFLAWYLSSAERLLVENNLLNSHRHPGTRRYDGTSPPFVSPNPVPATEGCFSQASAVVHPLESPSQPSRIKYLPVPLWSFQTYHTSLNLSWTLTYQALVPMAFHMARYKYCLNIPLMSLLVMK